MNGVTNTVIVISESINEVLTLSGGSTCHSDLMLR